MRLMTIILTVSLQVPVKPNLDSTTLSVIKATLVSQLGLTPQYGLVCNDKLFSCPQSALFGGLLRLPFHDAVGNGGPNGCVDFSHTLSKGLQQTVAALDLIHRNFSTVISKADLWVLASNLAVLYASTAPVGVSTDSFVSPPLDAVSTPLSLPFRYGRRDVSKCNDTGAIPDASFNFNKVQNLFGAKIGMSNEEIVAIMGGHSLGRAKYADSGFDGGWTPTQSSFSNKYYQMMGAQPWDNSNASNVWVEFKVVNEVMMLKPDIEMLYQTFPAIDKGRLPGFCSQFSDFYPNGNCPYQNAVRNVVKTYAKNIDLFYGNFSIAYRKMTEYMYPNGTLAEIDQPLNSPYPMLDGVLVVASPTTSPSTSSINPSEDPTTKPSAFTSFAPTANTYNPSYGPSIEPLVAPSLYPTWNPSYTESSNHPTEYSSLTQSLVPTAYSTEYQLATSSLAPSIYATEGSSILSKRPTKRANSKRPSTRPSKRPSKRPVKVSRSKPSLKPSERLRLVPKLV